MAEGKTIQFKGTFTMDAKDLEQFNQNLDETGKKTKDIGEKAKESKKGFSVLSGGIKGIGTALKAAGIGLFVTIIAGLFNLLKENQEVMDFFNKATKTMGILFNQLVELIGGPVSDIFSGWFKMLKGGFMGVVNLAMGVGYAVKGIFDDEAKLKSQEYFDAAKKNATETADGFKQMAGGIVDATMAVVDGVGNIETTFNEAWKSADKFVQKQNELILAEAELNKFIAKNKATMNELKLVRDDENASMADRIAASEKINELVAEEEAKSIALQEAKLAQMKADLDLTQTTVEDLANIANAEAQLDNLRADSATKLRENQMKINSLRKIAGDQNTELTQQEIVEAKAASAEAVRIEEEKLKKLEELKIASNQRIKDLRLQWAIEDAGTEDELYQAKLEKEKARFEEAMVIAGENAEMIANAEEENRRNKEQLEDEHIQRLLEKEKDKNDKKVEMTKQGLQLASSAVAAYGQFLDMQMNKELKAAEGNAAKQEQIRKEYGEKKKQAAIVQAIIDTALGVITAISQNPPPSPIGIISGAIVAAAGAIQIATISQQQFAQGGILNGPSHAQGGIATPFGELEGGEGIISASSMSNPSLRNLASAANRGGGGNDFSTGDGSVSLSSASISAIISGINDKKVYVSETDITTTQNKVKVVEAEAVL